MIEHPRDGEELAAAIQALAALDGFEGVPLSAGARELLRYFAAGDLDRPYPAIATDWEEVFRSVCRNGLVGLTARALARQDDERASWSPPASFRRAIARARSLTGLRLAILYRAVGATLSGLVEAGLDPIVLKGAALGQLVYPDPTMRTFGDLDLLLRERDVLAAHRALLAQGFEADQDPTDLPPRLVPQISVYELKYWHRARQLLVEIHVDDPFSSGLAARDLDGYWLRAVPIDVGGVRVKALSLDDQVLQLCTHAHYHSYMRLNWLSDLAFIIRDHGSSLDWRRITTTTRTEALEVPVYHSLRFLGIVLDVHAPANVLAALRPDRFRRWWHERYLPEEVVLALGPAPRPFAGFYYFPLFTRLLPDLLVMGRRHEKLHCLLRLLTPPPTWLRAYYRLTGAQSVLPHYLLHPLKLMVHALIEATRVVTGPRQAPTLGRATRREDRLGGQISTPRHGTEQATQSSWLRQPASGR